MVTLRDSAWLKFVWNGNAKSRCHQLLSPVKLSGKTVTVSGVTLGVETTTLLRVALTEAVPFSKPHH